MKSNSRQDSMLPTAGVKGSSRSQEGTVGVRLSPYRSHSLSKTSGSARTLAFLARPLLSLPLNTHSLSIIVCLGTTRSNFTTRSPGLQGHPLFFSSLGGLTHTIRRDSAEDSGMRRSSLGGVQCILPRFWEFYSLWSPYILRLSPLSGRMWGSL